MIALTLAQVAQAVGGRVDHGTGDELITGGVEFDSRKVGHGDLFVAIPGARVDGHDFAQRACDQGAVGVLAARPVGVPAVIVPPAPDELGSGNSYATEHDSDGSVAAVIFALGRLARAVLDRLDALTVIGVTGSAGKTSTKDIVATLCSQQGPTIAPPGSFNNEIGHPYTALQCDEETEFLVAEMSARGIGHVAHLATIAPPQIGVVLNVGTAHVGEFGSQENIAVAKGELVEALPASGVAVLNADDPFVAAMASRTRARVCRFSARGPADVWASDISVDALSRPRFVLHAGEHEAEVQLQIFGLHQVSNAVAAAAAALAAGVEFSDAATRLCEHRSASAHRMDVRTREHDQVVVIDDSYNANPESMRAGLRSLVAMKKPEAHAIAVLGPMSELGENAAEDHAEIARFAHEIGVSSLIVVGDNPNSLAVVEAASQCGVPTFSVSDTTEAARIAQQIIEAGDVVLVKASNAFRLWTVAEAVLAGNPSEERKSHADGAEGDSQSLSCACVGEKTVTNSSLSGNRKQDA
ncbi:UDP-N-acetylmuramoyl-tripeptide--D-alanyl-D-alanine ligase [Corynebacterium felinum]|uniref:UDP-N-acetylmuramoyl-tripeptide--D-alanyl-D-alanine ligase n=1 Tax=Corynebacterium felinum TaxID=131318 RepID=A0ABU2BBZ2_9CORY|nr:UDP-N-acetylmuramoyl-tripeptide--D-alanyl-D-alanine ligase [Corynebacterium felinum]MDF5820918.1 UDP-N-acetylmuramoyl-tripeptide--D-alanyl-D-alanine ligase [Corynebacterium felinum]MDR7356140.1 UDP-N-acetylmuramoyl-tripeptide--D-alanyl-D-alanine ligase [Corynebacterium felinum]WJY95474.1 UDP-N-acetylmuramoyl-tripeptide--D-alanyl-D-alanine ligase [Corynebacterium felinum]